MDDDIKILKKLETIYILKKKTFIYKVYYNFEEYYDFKVNGYAIRTRIGVIIIYFVNQINRLLSRSSIWFI